jgi:hypothetical protein
MNEFDFLAERLVPERIAAARRESVAITLAIETDMSEFDRRFVLESAADRTAHTRLFSRFVRIVRPARLLRRWAHRELTPKAIHG